MKAVLVVDDDKAFRDCLVTALEEDYNVSAAADDREALDRMQEGSVDLVILNLKAGVGGGLNVLCYAQASSRPPGVVVLTAAAGVGKAVKAMRLGALEFLIKPIGADLVRAVAAKVLESLSHCTPADYSSQMVDLGLSEMMGPALRQRMGSVLRNEE